MSEFTGFPRSGLDFLDTLGTKDKAWFEKHRTTYETDVVGPAKAFVSAMGESLGERISAHIQAQPTTNGSIAPINNDLRFAPGASPYKDHLLFRFWEGRIKKTAPTLMIRLSPRDGVGFASGVVLADLDRWRQCVDADAGTVLARELVALVEATGAEVVGQGLKKVPKPYAEDHPRKDLLRHKSFQVRWPEPMPPSVERARFVGWCADRLMKAAGVHRWLVAQLT